MKKVPQSAPASITVTEFKSKCLSVFDEISKTKKPVLITRHGKVIAEVGPPSPQRQGRQIVGAMVGTGKILGNIVKPVIDLND